jgi:hypothetical protein
MNHGTTPAPETVAGLRFIRGDIGSRTPGLVGKRCFGQLLSDPEFTDLAGFARAMDGLDRVREEGVYRSIFPNSPAQGTRLIPGQKALVSETTDKVFGVVSSKYAVVQDRAAFTPAYLAAKERGLTTVGRISGSGSGRTTGHVIIANPEYTVKLLDDTGEDVMLGVRLWNSYTGDMSFGGEVFGVRTVCVNYNLWGSLLGMFRLRHQDYAESVMDRYLRLIDGALDASSVLRDVAHVASQERIDLKLVPDVLWGAGLGAAAVDAIMVAPGQWEYTWAPVTSPKGPTAWQVYNAATAYVTYRDGGADHLRSTEDLSRKLVAIIDGTGADRLAAKGSKRREAYAEYLVSIRGNPRGKGAA